MVRVTALITACFLLSFVTGAEAGSWDDFVNNLSTDLVSVSLILS